MVLGIASVCLASLYHLAGKAHITFASGIAGYWQQRLQCILNVTALSCSNGGYYFYKRDKGFLQRERPSMLAVEDPQDPTNDLARGSYNIPKVPNCLSCL